MKNLAFSQNQKVPIEGLVSRYKVRQIKNFHLNLKAIQSEQHNNFLIQDNYLPFTVNSRQLPEKRNQIVINQWIETKNSSFRPIENVKLQDQKRKNKSLSKMPNITREPSSKTQNVIIKENNGILHKKIEIRKKIVSERPHYSSNHKVKRCSCGKCEQCMKDFAHYLHMISDDRSLPEISAKSWCIWKQKDEKFSYYYGKRIHKVREIASLTKMTTAMVLIDYAHKYNFDLSKTKFTVRKSSALVGGTTAKLNVGEVYTLKELLYGMMLPSGNDAAIAISEAISLMIHLKSKNKYFDPHWEDWFQGYLNKSYSYLFINAMNQKVQRLSTIDTKFYNSHGNDAFDQLKNISTCNQVAKISSEFLKYPQLKQVVKTIQFTFSNGTKVENTNKLLEDGFQGIKTGITETAGPCLAACYKDLIIIVLNSKSMDSRWIEVKKLVKWIKSRP